MFSVRGRGIMFTKVNARKGKSLSLRASLPGQNFIEQLYPLPPTHTWLWLLQVHESVSSSYWFIGSFSLAVIGQSDLDLTTLDSLRKRPTF